MGVKIKLFFKVSIKITIVEEFSYSIGTTDGTGPTPTVPVSSFLRISHSGPKEDLTFHNFYLSVGVPERSKKS